MLSFCQAENWTSCLTTFEIWLAAPCSAETVLPRQTGKWSRPDWDKQRRCVFMAYISPRQMVLHAISAPQHYLHLGFIRAILTRVPSDRWQWDFFFFLYRPCRAAEACQKKKQTIMMELRFDCLCLDLFFFFFYGSEDGSCAKNLQILSIQFSVNNSFITPRLYWVS